MPASPDKSGERRHYWRQLARGISFDAAVIMLAATVLIILFHENGSSLFFRRHFAPLVRNWPLHDLYPAIYWFGCSLLMLGLLPYLLGRWVLGFRPAELGVGLGDWRFGLKAVAVLYLLFLPVLVATSYLPQFQTKYPLFAAATLGGGRLLVYELAYAVYFLGWEFVFRGFLLFGLKPTLGLQAVFVQTIPFAILHFGKAEVETLAAVGAGVILGFLALRARSFWYGWLLHSLIAVSNDLLAMWHKHLL